ncbi:MAG: hypothetical protein HYX39_03400, partial [Bacteroidetes bacterium]|nr:hypothetical protein [Bacteroidota bacterium]
MKNTKLLLLSVAVGLLQGTSFAQSSSANNAFLFGNFLGWNNTNGANILPFRTNNVQRLQINGTSNLAAPFNTNGNNTGYVGFGL